MDLRNSLTLSLRNQEEHKYGSNNHETGEEPEATVDAQSILHDRETESDYEHQHPVHNDGDTSRSTSELNREQLSHHHPRYGTEAHGEGNDEQDQTY